MASRGINKLTPPWGTVGFNKETHKLFKNVSTPIATGVTWNVEIYGYRIAGSDEVHIVILHSGQLDKVTWSSNHAIFGLLVWSLKGHSMLHLPREGDSSNPAVISFHENVNLMDGNDDVFPYTLELEDQWVSETKTVIHHVSNLNYKFGPVGIDPVVYNQPLFGLTQFKLPGGTETQYAIIFNIAGTSLTKTIYFNLPKE
ncbi:hypothetical protein C8R43DRAFT_1135149 [Mycena crocata]|nr:hypothetical protein C8R43DRAFT_1135149 [Mycena crocata]